MEKKPSIWQREINLSDSGLFAALSPKAAQWAAAICAGAFIVSPLIVSIPCLIHHSFDYTVYTHPAIVRGMTWPVAALSGAVALILACGQGFRAGWRPHPWLRKNPVFLCFGALVLWMLLSTAVNGWEFLFAVDAQHLRFESFFMQLGYFLILFPAAALLRDRRIRLWLVRLHEAVSLLLVPAALFLWRTQIDSAQCHSRFQQHQLLWLLSGRGDPPGGGHVRIGAAVGLEGLFRGDRSRQHRGPLSEQHHGRLGGLRRGHALFNHRPWGPGAEDQPSGSADHPSVRSLPVPARSSSRQL